MVSLIGLIWRKTNGVLGGALPLAACWQVLLWLRDPSSLLEELQLKIGEALLAAKARLLLLAPTFINIIPYIPLNSIRW